MVGHAEARRLLPMKECIGVMEDMFKTLANGDAVLPLRQTVWQPDRKGLLGSMPGYLGSPRAIGAKVISFFPGNTPPFESHQGAVLLFDSESGQLLAVVDATTITNVRTAAASAAATKALARKEASKLAILGAGTQAAMHLESMQLVRDIDEVRVWNRTSSRAEAFIEKESSKGTKNIRRTDTAEEAVTGADLVCTTTAATSPILRGKWLSKGSHINAIGSSVAPFRELDTDALVRCRLYTDRRESLLSEANDFRVPMEEGAIGVDHLVGEIGEVLTGKVPGRRDDFEITLFKSLGLAVEDIASAVHIYTRAKQEGLGEWVEFSGERES